MQHYSVLELSRLNDEDIKTLFLKIRSLILANQRKNISSKEDEIYFCYIVRELEIRNQNLQNTCK